MKCFLFSMTFVTLLLSSSVQALVPPQDIVCSSRDGALTFHVSFNGLYENSIIIKNAKTGRMVTNFNNYYGRGADSIWVSGAGSWMSDKNTCYLILGYHKKGTPNPGLPFKKSKMRRDGDRIGFEDATDNDYNDAVVEISK